MSLAVRVAAARRGRGLSRRGLSLGAGLSQAITGQIERGDIVSPGTATIEALAHALDVDPAWLAWGTGTPPVLPAPKAPADEVA